MHDTGRTSGRLASSYREDDLRRADERRRSQPTPDDEPKPAVERAPGLVTTTILRLGMKRRIA